MESPARVLLRPAIFLMGFLPGCGPCPWPIAGVTYAVGVAGGNDARVEATIANTTAAEVRIDYLTRRSMGISTNPLSVTVEGEVLP